MDTTGFYYTAQGIIVYTLWKFIMEKKMKMNVYVCVCVCVCVTESLCCVAEINTML